jgi:hypothetical protein
MTPCDVVALKKCLEEHKGDGEKCKEQIAAFKTACSASPAAVSSSSSSSSQRAQLSSSRSAVTSQASH